jgi:hypothetical protein
VSNPSPAIQGMEEETRLSGHVPRGVNGNPGKSSPMNGHGRKTSPILGIYPLLCRALCVSIKMFSISAELRHKLKATFSRL